MNDSFTSFLCHYPENSFVEGFSCPPLTQPWMQALLSQQFVPLLIYLHEFVSTFSNQPLPLLMGSIFWKCARHQYECVLVINHLIFASSGASWFSVSRIPQGGSFSDILEKSHTKSKDRISCSCAIAIYILSGLIQNWWRCWEQQV